jgi:hypothetical protein
MRRRIRDLARDLQRANDRQQLAAQQPVAPPESPPSQVQASLAKDSLIDHTVETWVAVPLPFPPTEHPLLWKSKDTESWSKAWTFAFAVFMIGFALGMLNVYFWTGVVSGVAGVVCGWCAWSSGRKARQLKQQYEAYLESTNQEKYTRYSSDLGD